MRFATRFAVVAALLCGPAWAAVPTLVDSSSGSETSNTTTHSVLLPTTVNSGDLLLVWMSFDGSPTVTWDNSTAGVWTVQQDADCASAACHLTIYAKVADGTEGGLTLSIGTSASEQSVFRAVSYGTWEGTLAGGLNVPAYATGTSANPNPPAATDAWGSVDRRTIAVEAADGARTVTTFPSGYTLNQFDDSSGGGAGVGLGSAALDSAPGTSQNPGSFTITASDQWAAATISIRGAVAAACTPSMTLLGVGACG